MTLKFWFYHCKIDFTRQFPLRAKNDMFYDIAGNKIVALEENLRLHKNLSRLHVL